MTAVLAWTIIRFESGPPNAGPGSSTLGANVKPDGKQLLPSWLFQTEEAAGATQSLGCHPSNSRSPARLMGGEMSREP